MIRRLTIGAACLALAAGALAGCGDDDDEGTGQSGAATVATTGGTSAGGAEGTNEQAKVDMKNSKNSPEELTVNVGQKVVWTNSDAYPHTATAQNGEFDSGTIEGGGTFEWTAEKAGEFDYVCKIHPNQTGSITVQ